MNAPAIFSLFAQAFGWAVLQSTWQIALVWLLFIGLRLLLRRRNQGIYLMSFATMSAAGIWFAATFYARFVDLSTWSVQMAEPEPDAVAAWSGSASLPETSLPVAWWEGALDRLENHTLLIGGAWSLCVALLWLRLVGGWWMVQRLRRRDIIAPPESLQNLCNEWTRKLRIDRAVRMFESPHVREPLTLGFWKPIILFPAGMLLSVTPSQLEALLLHELAHIRRHDYLFNLFQMALETCFFYHPLFWLMSREARARREFCCDDVVLRFTDDPLGYAQILTHLQISFLQPSMQFTMNATGKSRFAQRIWRIAGVDPRRESRPNWLLLLLLPLLVSLGVWWPTQAAAPRSPETELLPSDTIAPKPAVPAKKEQTPLMPEKAKPAPARDLGNFVDDLGKKYNSERISVNLEPAAPENVAIQVTKMNVLYIGVDNPIRIAASDVSNSELQVKLIGEGSIEGADGIYNIRVTQPGEVTVRVMRKTGEEIKFVVDQKYRVKYIPDPIPRLDGRYFGGAMAKADFLKTNAIVATQPNFDFDVNWEVLGYELTIVPKQKDPVSFNVVGDRIPARALELLQGDSDGDAVFFDDIKVKFGDKDIRNIGGLAFKLRSL